MNIQIPNLANPTIKDNVDMTFDNNEDIQIQTHLYPVINEYFYFNLDSCSKLKNTICINIPVSIALNNLSNELNNPFQLCSRLK